MKYFDLDIHDEIAKQAFHNFILHGKSCEKCQRIYKDFINERMVQNCFKIFHEEVLNNPNKYSDYRLDERSEEELN